MKLKRSHHHTNWAKVKLWVTLGGAYRGVFLMVENVALEVFFFGNVVSGG